MSLLTAKKIDMPFKLILNSFFDINAIIAWTSSVTLVFIGGLSISEIISALAAVSGTVLAVCTGFFATLKMYENYLESRSKRREQEHREKEELENDNSKD
jgi:hypothetical protein